MEVKVKEEDVIKGLKQCFDPEIPANIYDLGLVYKIEINGTEVNITMTLTSPFCPVTDYLVEDIKGKVIDFSGATKVNLNITFDPPWTKDRMTDEARAELGI